MEIKVIFDDGYIQNRRLNIEFCADCGMYHFLDQDCVMKLVEMQEWIELPNESGIQK